METLLARIKRHEGFLRIPKYDAKGKYAVGYGHDITPEQANAYANGISEAEAQTLLESDIVKAQADLSVHLGWTDQLPNIQWQVLVEMVFQMGVNGLLGFKNFLFFARSGDKESAYLELLWNHYNKDNPGKNTPSDWHNETPARCEELAGLWLNGTTT